MFSCYCYHAERTAVHYGSERELARLRRAIRIRTPLFERRSPALHMRSVEAQVDHARMRDPYELTRFLYSIRLNRTASFALLTWIVSILSHVFTLVHTYIHTCAPVCIVLTFENNYFTFPLIAHIYESEYYCVSTRDPFFFLYGSPSNSTNARPKGHKKGAR